MRVKEFETEDEAGSLPVTPLRLKMLTDEQRIDDSDGDC